MTHTVRFFPNLTTLTGYAQMDAVNSVMDDLNVVANGHLSYEATVTNAILEHDSTLTIAPKHNFDQLYAS